MNGMANSRESPFLAVLLLSPCFVLSACGNDTSREALLRDAGGSDTSVADGADVVDVADEPVEDAAQEQVDALGDALEDAADDTVEAAPTVDQAGCAAALPIADGETHATSIAPGSGVATYYSYPASAGAFTAITGTIGTNTYYWTRPHPVVTILDASGNTTLAATDTYDFAGMAFPSFTVDLVYHAPTEQTLCLKFEDYASWTSSGTPIGVVCDYSLSLEDASEAHRFTVDSEPNDDLATAQLGSIYAQSSEGTSYALVGTLSEAQDADVYRLPVPAGMTVVEVIYGPPPGPGGPGVEGTGSTLELGPIEVTDAAGNLLARAAPSGSRAIWVWIRPSDDELFVHLRRKPGSAVGTNDFYFLHVRGWHKAIAGGWLEKETQAGQNDTQQTAELRSGSLLEPLLGIDCIDMAGELSDTGVPGTYDVDNFSFEAFANSQVEVFCDAACTGAGLRNARFTLLDESQNILASSVEDDSCPVVWGDWGIFDLPKVFVPNHGLLTLQVTADGQDPDVRSRSYHCALVQWVE